MYVILSHHYSSMKFNDEVIEKNNTTSNYRHVLYVGIKVKILARTHVKGWIKFTVEIEKVFKWTGETRLREGKKAVWVRRRDDKCSCPKLRLNRHYLIVGFNDIHEIQKGIVVSQRTVVTQWSDKIAKRVAKFQTRQKKGICLSTNLQENF